MCERLKDCYQTEMYLQRNPSVQAEIDPEKKTIVVLGSGWASTSFLKDIDTDHYNVVMYTKRKNISLPYIKISNYI